MPEQIVVKLEKAEALRGEDEYGANPANNLHPNYEEPVNLIGGGAGDSPAPLPLAMERELPSASSALSRCR